MNSLNPYFELSAILQSTISSLSWTECFFFMGCSKEIISDTNNKRLNTVFCQWNGVISVFLRKVCLCEFCELRYRVSEHQELRVYSRAPQSGLYRPLEWIKVSGSTGDEFTSLHL